MTLAAAPQEGGGDKIVPLYYDNGAALVPAAFRGIADAASVTGDHLAHLGVGTHKDADTFAAASAAVVLAAGHDGATPGTVRKILVDSVGRQVVRPLGLYSASGTPAYAELLALGHAAVAGVETAWLGVGTHIAGAVVSTTVGAVAVAAGKDPNGNAFPVLVDAAGHLLTDTGQALTGTGHVAVASNHVAIVVRATTPARRVRVRADAGNAGTIYVGIATVTDDSVAATGGLQLAAGAAETIELGPTGNLGSLFVNGVAGVGASFAWFA